MNRLLKRPVQPRALLRFAKRRVKGHIPTRDQLPTAKGLLSARIPPRALLPYMVLAVVFGVFYSAFVSPQSLALGNVGWVAEGDLRQHYLGWIAYLNSESTGRYWGQSQLLAYPVGAPISATDSNPLYSFIFGTFAHWLPGPVQFIGVQYFLNMAIALLVSFALVKKVGYDKMTAAFFAGIVAFPPLLFWRFGHDTLTTQWLILGHIWVSLSIKRPFRAALSHGGLLAIAIMVHPYLFVMNALIVGFDIAFKVIEQRKIRWGNFEIIGLLVLLAVFLAVYLGGKVGVFGLKNPYPNEVGVFSTDLLGMFNSFGMSRLFSGLSAADGQYEGFAYIGLGGMALFAVTFIVAMCGNAQKIAWRQFAPMAAAALVALIIALGPHITALGKPVLTFDLSDGNPLRLVLEKLRSHGRFVWTTSYVLVLVALALLPRNMPMRMRALAMAVLALQLWDTKPLQEYSRELTAAKEHKDTQFETAEWQERIAGADYIYITDYISNETIFDLADIAFPQGIPMTRFYTAQDLGLPEQFEAVLNLKIRTLNGDLDDNALYLLDPTFDVPLLHQNAPKAVSTVNFGEFALVLNPKAGIAGAPSSGDDLYSMVKDCSAGCAALIVTQGAAQAKLSDSLKAIIDGRGGQLSALREGGAYAALMQDGAIVEQTLTGSGAAVLNADLDGLAVSLSAAPVGATDPAVIRIAGSDFGRGRNGVSIVQVWKDGTIRSATFDTATTPDSPELDAETLSEDRTVAALDNYDFEDGFYAPLSGAEPFLDINRFLAEDSSLFEVLTTCQIGCSMAISVKDEATTALPRDVRHQAGRMGLALAELEFRDGFAAIVEDGTVLVQGRSHNDVVEIAEKTQGRNVAVKSAGYEGGSVSSIVLDGEELSFSRRGINIVVFNNQGQQISFHFDTHGAI